MNFRRSTVPDVRIIGGPEIYVKSDNRLNLRCRVTKCIEPPELVEWYKDSRRISVTSSRLRIVYDKRLSDDGSATSTLEISKAVKSDSGLYSCKPSHLESSNVTVTVVNGTSNFTHISRHSAHCDQKKGAPSFFRLTKKRERCKCSFVT